MNKAIIAVGLVAVIMVSGCTNFNIGGREVDINNIIYDTFTKKIDSASCTPEFERIYPEEDDFSCSVKKVDFHTKMFDCRCTINGGLI